MYEYEADGLPYCTLDVAVDTDTGRATYTATCTVVGFEPNRGTNTDERIAGIESLSPPTVITDTTQGVFDLIERACLAAAESTGLEYTADLRNNIAIRTRWSLSECFRLAGIDS